jgi:hypothetical protein
MMNRTMVLVALTVAFAAPVRAEGTDPCRTDAREGFRTCKHECRDAFRQAKDTCSTRDPVCVDGCRTGRQACRAPFEAERDAAVAVCDATLHDAKQVCRGEFAEGTGELDGCIDQAQGVAFACRDAAREAVHDDLRACARTFRACVIDTCPPEVPVDRAAFRACRLDARDLMLGCLADCREAFQLDKDTCLDRDHACVEVCRAERTECRAPILAVLDAALAACTTDRQATVDTCRTLYAADTPERDACIDQAQLEAFACRDAAREIAKPDLRVCREAFVGCAQACPPPSGSASGAFLD